MPKTRLKLDVCHGIGEHLIDAAAEVGVETVALLVVVIVLTGRVLNKLRSKKCARALGKLTGADSKQRISNKENRLANNLKCR